MLDRQDEPDLPRLFRSGRWLATPGRFFDGRGGRITEDELVRVAVHCQTAEGCRNAVPSGIVLRGQVVSG